MSAMSAEALLASLMAQAGAQERRQALHLLRPGLRPSPEN
jgi:hypothetical protein